MEQYQITLIVTYFVIGVAIASIYVGWVLEGGDYKAMGWTMLVTFVSFVVLFWWIAILVGLGMKVAEVEKEKKSGHES